MGVIFCAIGCGSGVAMMSHVAIVPRSHRRGCANQTTS